MIDPKKIVPLDGCVLVKMDALPEKTKGGIIMLEQAKGREQHGQQHGVVVAIGDNAFREWGDAVRPIEGDRVLFTRYAGQSGFAETSDEDRDTYRMVVDEDITGVVRA